MIIILAYRIGYIEEFDQLQTRAIADLDLLHCLLDNQEDNANDFTIRNFLISLMEQMILLNPFQFNDKKSNSINFKIIC